MSNYILISRDDADAFIAHSSGPWKNHKYIRKEGNHYIYSTRESARISNQKRNILGINPHKAKDLLQEKRSKRKIRKLNTNKESGDYDIHGYRDSSTIREQAVGKLESYKSEDPRNKIEGSKERKQTAKQTSMRGVKVKKESAMDKAVRKATIKRRRLY